MRHIVLLIKNLNFTENKEVIREIKYSFEKISEHVIQYNRQISIKRDSNIYFLSHVRFKFNFHGIFRKMALYDQNRLITLLFSNYSSRRTETVYKIQGVPE